VIPIIPLNKPYFNNDEMKEIKKVLDSGIVSGLGPESRLFEIKFSKYINMPFCVAVSNCTTALHLALKVIGVNRGDEVLVADYSFPATGHAVLYNNAKPTFIDIDPHTYNINHELIEEKITERTKAILPVHTFGQVAEMKKIMKIAKKNSIKVIEDAACALGAKYAGKHAGTFGDISCFSFHGRKGLTTGEGGMITTRKKNWAERARQLAAFGTERFDSAGLKMLRFVQLGYNYKLSDIASAIGIAQLHKYDLMLKKRRELAKYYDEKIEKISFLNAPYSSPKGEHAYQSYVPLTTKKELRNRLILHLMKNNIQSQIGTYAMHIQPVYRSNQKCPVSLDIFNRAIALPLYYEMTFDKIDKVISTIKKIRC
jgi:dTDP-4-amino-4,6-dideoxygalactose transaminase